MRSSIFKGLLRYFPTPGFLTMPAVGLELAPDAVRFLELREKGGGYQIGRYGEYPLPDTVGDEEFPSGEDLKAFLVGIREKHKLGFISAALPEEKAYIFSTDIPMLSPEEMREGIELRLEEHVPIAAKDAVFDYCVIDTDESSKRCRVNVSVAPHHLVSRYFEFFTSAGLTPLSFQISAQAAVNAVVPDGNNTPLIVVNFGARQTGLYLVSRRIVHFTSTVNVGGDSLTEAIKKYFSVSKEDAEKIKSERGISRDKRDADLFFSLVSTLSALKDEVEKLVAYWDTYHGRYTAEKEKIMKVILCGRESGLQGLPDYLEASLNVSVELGDVWCNVFSFDSYIPPLTRRESLAYTEVIGLSLRAP